MVFHPRMQLAGYQCAILAIALLAGCTTSAPVTRGEVQGASVTVGEIAQSYFNRVATVTMRANLDSLAALMDKLYKRNPREWRKHATSQAAASERVLAALKTRTPWPELGGKRDIEALSLALDPNFSGDRVAAFIYALGDMLIMAHGNRMEFYLLDGLDAQHLYNAARNLEVAAWILASRRDASQRPLLLSNEISDAARNVTFEREFGKMIGRVDLVASLVTEKYRRAGIGYVHSLFGAQFLQFLPVR